MNVRTLQSECEAVLYEGLIGLVLMCEGEIRLWKDNQVFGFVLYIDG